MWRGSCRLRPLCPLSCSGEILCALVNAVRPGTIPRVHESQLGFEQVTTLAAPGEGPTRTRARLFLEIAHYQQQHCEFSIAPTIEQGGGARVGAKPFVPFYLFDATHRLALLVSEL